MMSKSAKLRNKTIASILVLLILAVSVTVLDTAGAATLRRYDTVRITDADCLTQYCDTVRLPETMSDYLRITISARIAEIDDGFQSILLFKGAGATLRMYEFKFEHSSGRTDTTAKTVICSATFKKSTFGFGEIALRYGGSGTGADSFYIGELYVDFADVTSEILNCNITVGGSSYSNRFTGGFST